MSGKQQDDFVVLYEEQSVPLCLLSFLSLNTNSTKLVFILKLSLST